MKTKNLLALFLGLAAAGSAAWLAAQENGSVRAVGHVLLLQSELGLEGEIEKFGEQYRVRRGASEVWLPADKAARLCADWEDAYAFMKTRANLGDPEERLRLARWCQRQNLRPQALIEAKAALDMRPTHETTRQLVAILTRSVASPAGPSIKPAPAKTGAVAVVAPALDISADSSALFATRVQPILMNACVNCHSGGRGGDFQLVHGDAGQRGASQTNLAAVLAQVKMTNPALSPLLIKAVSRHGNAANAPIKDRQAIPFKTLQAWIDYLLTNNPHLKYQAEAVAADATTPAPAPVRFAQATLGAQPSAKAAPRTEFANASGATVQAQSLPRSAKVTTALTPASAPGSNDETQAPALNSLDTFDPAVFNRQAPPRQ